MNDHLGSVFEQRLSLSQGLWRRYFKNLGVISGLIVCSVTSLYSQSASVSGRVIDQSDAVIRDVSVVLTATATGVSQKTVTNSNGFYAFPYTQVGKFTLSATVNGFKRYENVALTLEAAQSLAVDIRLELGSSSETLTIDGNINNLNTVNASVGSVVSNSQIKNLPLNGRSWSNVMSLVPGAIDLGQGSQRSIRFAGGGVDDINFRLDGVDMTGITQQSPTAAFRLQISTEAIEEFRVDSGLYSAEKGGTSGGQLEIITRSGTNSFHGSLFEYLRNNALGARGPFDIAGPPPLRLNQFGGSFGGPLRKNRTFFFGAYEGIRQRVGTTLIGNVPSEEFRAQVLRTSPELVPVLNAWPVGLRPVSADVSQYVSTSNVIGNEDSGFIRVDHRVSDSINVFGRFNFDNAYLSSPRGTLLDREIYTPKPKNGLVNISQVFSPTAFNNLHIGLNRIHTERMNESNLWTVSNLNAAIQVPGFTTLNQIGNSVQVPTTMTLKDDFSLVRRSHSIKMGIEVKRINFNYNSFSTDDYVFSDRPSFAENAVNIVNLNAGLTMRGLSKTMYSAYIQDQWRATENLTIGLGLRYDFFSVFKEKYGRVEPFDIQTCGGPCARGSDVMFPVKTNFSPRISLAWTPNTFKKKVVIRTGFGLYRGEGQLAEGKEPSDNDTKRFRLSSADVSGLQFPADQLFTEASLVAAAPRQLSRERKEPTVAQWGLQIQAELKGNFILDTGYIGSKASHQYSRIHANLINPITGTRPISGYGLIEAKHSDGTASFNGWQTSLRRRFQNGFYFGANYMWSHSLNDGSVGSGEAVYPQNAACRSCEWASSDLDVRQFFNTNFVYELPFGLGKKYLNEKSAINYVLGGWQLSGLATFRSGLPVNVTISRSSTAMLDGNANSPQRPDIVPGISLYPDNGKTTNHWINPAAFTLPASGTWGNAGRNIARGPRFGQFDLGAIKNILITESVSFSFRAEAFNLLNRAQFGNPSGNFSSPNFGQITTTVNGGTVTGSGTPRQFQLSLRLSF